MTIFIAINTDNAAFEDDREQEIAHVLRKIGRQITNGRTIPFKATDANGNTVATVIEEEAA